MLFKRSITNPYIPLTPHFYHLNRGQTLCMDKCFKVHKFLCPNLGGSKNNINYN